MKTLFAALYAALALTLFVAQPAQAQTIDLSTLNIGAVVGLPTAIETDGNLSSQEWLLSQVFTANKRIVRVTAAGAVCMGPWFAVGSDWTLQRQSNGLFVYTRLLWPLFSVLSLQPYQPTGC